MLSPETLNEIAAKVRTGFYGKDRLMGVFCEEMYAPGELERNEVRAAIDIEWANWEVEKQTWPEVTDCDRLDSAFAAMNSRGVIALQNAGYTQSDGYDDFRDAYQSFPNKASVLGYCFYHGQDLDRAVLGHGLYLAFGPVDPQAEETIGPKVGNVVREELERVGLSVEWDGKFSSRLLVPELDWKRR